jgi:membrane protein implicated in regulation of membrane protease activity
VGTIYIAALIVGGGAIAVQLLMSAGGDADADVQGDVDADADHSGHGHHAGDGSGILPIFLSLRFWTYALLAFGLVGTLLWYLGLAPEPVTAVVAAVMGLSSGFTASWLFRALARSETGASSDAVGQVGRVLLPCAKGRRGKVRIQLHGQTLDVLATTDEEELPAGSAVLVEEMRGEVAHVSPAPADFLETPPIPQGPRSP